MNTREGCKKGFIQKCKRGINLTDGIDTALISTSVIMAGISDAIFRDCCNCLWVHGRLREIGETLINVKGTMRLKLLEKVS